MSSLKTRLIKLESSMVNDTEPLRIARFIVSTGIEPKGYSCGDINIIREPGETNKALHKRCIDSVEWTDGNCRNIFEPLEH